MRVLFHVCCGPCFARAGSLLRDEGHEVTAFWYNPNVQPYREFEARLGAFQQVCEAEGFPTIVDPAYEPERWLRAALDAEDRCETCYRDRLARTAERAAAEGFEAITTTLLASPHQRHGMARRVGEDEAQRAGIAFVYRDWRERWKDARARTFELGVYRQGYCGCVLSERDRYLGVPEEEGSEEDSE